jgi:hypothetical protein
LGMPYAAFHSRQSMVVGSTKETGLRADEALAFLLRSEARAPAPPLLRRSEENGEHDRRNHHSPNFQVDDAKYTRLGMPCSTIADTDATACSYLHKGIAAVWAPAHEWTVSKVRLLTVC